MTCGILVDRNKRSRPYRMRQCGLRAVRAEATFGRVIATSGLLDEPTTCGCGSMGGSRSPRPRAADTAVTVWTRERRDLNVCMLMSWSSARRPGTIPMSVNDERIGFLVFFVFFCLLFFFFFFFFVVGDVSTGPTPPPPPG